MCMSLPLKINVVLNIIGMARLAIITSIIVLMALTGTVLPASQRVLATRVIIKTRVGIVLLFHKHAYPQQFGTVRNVKLMEHVHLAPTIVEAVVRIMFLVRMDMFGIVSISHVIVQQENNQMVMLV